MDLHNFYENKKRDNKKYIYIKTVVGISQKNKQNSYYEEFSENRKVYEGVACKISNEWKEEKALLSISSLMRESRTASY